MKRLDQLHQMIADETDDCIIWPYSLVSGYAQVWDGQRPVRGHVLACEHRNGPKPHPKMHAAHSCGRPACINPRHLRWATPTENMEDTFLHGTHSEGERQWAHKLTEADVAEIRRRYAAGGVLQRELAAEYGVKREAISKIVLGKRWRMRSRTLTGQVAA